jgi:predicted nucleic acid-binding protein
MMQREGNRSDITKYVLDSYSLLAYLEAEPGSERVRELLQAAKAEECHIYMCVVNLGEVMYIIERERGLSEAQDSLATINDLPIEIINADHNVTMEAAHIKADCPVAYADCFAAALTRLNHAILITGDSEFRKIETGLDLHIEWIAHS